MHRLKDAHLRPQPRLTEGRAMADAAVSAAIDVSDGLVADLAKLCEASGVGAEIDSSSVPVDPTLPSAFPDDWLEMALGGGEDYELLFTAPAKAVERDRWRDQHSRDSHRQDDGCRRGRQYPRRVGSPHRPPPRGMGSPGEHAGVVDSGITHAGWHRQPPHPGPLPRWGEGEEAAPLQPYVRLQSVSKRGLRRLP